MMGERWCATSLESDEGTAFTDIILRSFLSGRDLLYFSAPTGFGKSLVFQSLPVLYDTMQDNLIGTTFVLVLSPLVSLIEEQVAY